MEQTTNLPALNIEVLSNLPETLVANGSLADRAVVKVSETIAPMKALDLTTVAAEAMEANDATLATLQSKLKESYTMMQDRRKPFTQLFDDIKSRFTAEEKKVTSIGEEVKALRDGWQKEKARRNEAARQEAELKAQAQSAVIEAKAYFKQFIVDKYSTAAVQYIQRMHTKFNSLDAAGLDKYATQLKDWSGAIDGDTWKSFLSGMINPKPQLLTGEQMQSLLNEVEVSLRTQLAGEWQDRMVTEKNMLIEMVPSRKMELERIASDAAAAKEAEERIAAEQREREEAAKREAAERAAAMETEAEVEKVNAAFDAAAEQGNVVSLAKGTVVKKKYVAKTHAAWVAIIQSWVANDMAKMTPDELTKKLSFMKTACEGRLNKGEELKAAGLEVEDDYSTRSSRKKEVA